MTARPTDLDLMRVAAWLTRPLAAWERREARRIIAGYALAPPAERRMTADEARAALLAAAADLAGHGWGEMDIRDLLADDDACLDRAGRRRTRG